MEWCKYNIPGKSIILSSIFKELKMTLQSEKTIDTIQEGQATISITGNQEVFYNPVQEYNRDLSIAVIKTFLSIYKEELKSRIHQPLLHLLYCY